MPQQLREAGCCCKIGEEHAWQREHQAKSGGWHGHIRGAARHLVRQKVGGWVGKIFLSLKREDFAV